MKKKAALILALVLCACPLLLKHRLEQRLAERIVRRPPIPITQSAYQSHSLKRYSLGFDNLIADLIWIQLLQKASHEALSSGSVSWEYAQLEALTTLDPGFERAYSFGAAFLSVFRQDKFGAKLLLEKWVKRRPDYWKSHYTLGYHLFLEMANSKDAAPQILTAASLPGAPTWLSSLGIRLLSESGALAQALKVSLELYQSLRDDEAKWRMRMRVRSLRFNLQRAAWERALAEYRGQHDGEPPGSGVLHETAVREERELASIVATEETPDELRPLLAETFSFRYDADSHSIKAVLPPGEKGLDRIGIFRPKN